MNALSDQQLLHAYADRHSDAAFGELVRRHVDIVYSAARRMIGEEQSARDITQAVFLALAQNAASLTQHPVLSGWLHCTARNLAAKSVRAEVRRRACEQEAATMSQLLSAESEVPWELIAPHLDVALGELSDSERDAVMLRYFENKSAPEMAGILGISSEAAQKRVGRGVERLRDYFAKHGLTVGGSGLIVLISTNAVQAAPVGLAAAISAAALAGTTLTAASSMTAAKALAMTTIHKTLIAATVIAALSIAVYEVRRASNLRLEVNALQQQAPFAGKIEQLTRERDEATLKLTALRDENERLKRDTGELPRLRGRVAAAQQAQKELSARLPEDDSGFRMRRDKMNYLANWGLALKLYASTNNGLLPTTLAEASPSMPNPDAFFASVGSQFQVENFEMVCQGSLTNLGSPVAIIVVREKAPVRVSNGSWARAYLFADGHTEIRFSADGDFKAWEQEHMPRQSNP